MHIQDIEDNALGIMLVPFCVIMGLQRLSSLQNNEMEVYVGICSIFFLTTTRVLHSISTGVSPIVSVSWLSMLNMLVTLTKEGTVQVWRVRVNQDPNKPHMRANFLEPAGNL